MECWILYHEDIDSARPGSYEIRRFMEAGRQRGLQVKVFKPEQFDLVVTRDDRESVLVNGNVMSLPDFILPRTGATGSTYFALAVMRQLERLGVRCFNDSVSIEAVADKLHTQQILAEKGIPVPNTMLAKFPAVNTELVETTLGFPVVVKTLVGTQGSGVFLCDTGDQFNDLMDLIGETQPNLHLIFQEFIAASRGRDLRVFVVAGKVVAAMQRRATDGSFKANFSRGGKVEQFDVSPEIAQLALDTAATLNLRVAGIDILFDQDGTFKICEANSAPDFRGLESCCEVDIAGAILEATANRVAEEKGIDPLFDEKELEALPASAEDVAAMNNPNSNGDGEQADPLLANWQNT